MNTKIAEEIGKKARAYKYAERLIDKVDKQGRVVVKFGNTGIVVPVEKGDVMYTFFQSVKYQMLHEMTALEVSSSQIAPRSERRSLPAPIGAAPAVNCNDAVEEEGQNVDQQKTGKAYRQEYYQKHRESILASQKAYRERKKAEKAKSQAEAARALMKVDTEPVVSEEELKKQQAIEKSREYSRNYRRNNPEKIKAYKKKYVEGHREHLREYARSYYAKKKAEKIAVEA